MSKDLISRVLEQHFRETVLVLTIFVFICTHFNTSSATTSKTLRKQFAAVDEDDNGKLRLTPSRPEFTIVIAIPDLIVDEADLK